MIKSIPAVHQSTVPPGRFRKLTFERLDVRLPLSAEGPFPDVAPSHDTDLIEVRMAVSPVGGTSIADGVLSLSEGERFVIDVFVRETEDAILAKAIGREFYGIFQARIDLQYDPEIVRPVIDEIDHGLTFDWLVGGEHDPVAGVIRNLGGLDTSYIGKTAVGQSTLSRSETLLVSVPFTTLSAGDPGIVPSVGQDPESFLGLGFQSPIAPADVAFQVAPLRIVSPTVIDSTTEQTVLNTAEDLPTIVAGNFSASFNLNSSPDDGSSSIRSELNLVGLDDSIDGSSLLLNPTPLARGDSALPKLNPIQDRSRDQWESSVPIEDPLGDKSSLGFSIEPTGPADQTTSQPNRRSILDFWRDKHEDDLAERFWFEFDLGLLDDTEIMSPMELHFRLYPLQLSEATEKEQQNVKAKKQGQEAEVPSIVDLGLADIALWLLDAEFRSWPEPEFAETRPDSRLPPHDATKAATAPVAWSPRADVSVAARLELVEETRADPFAAHAELMRRFGGESFDRVDANTAIPDGDQASIDQSTWSAGEFSSQLGGRAVAGSES